MHQVYFGSAGARFYKYVTCDWHVQLHEFTDHVNKTDLPGAISPG